ncbi:SusC/RagA family TonB-linked outer membrane protein [Chishuiella changwenlii]|uniref:SusC/RagA family TonB-linked outer membrane protein n=1 Tax=Chishuiella changwenlii TaxID=1434701 RepID=UPI002FD90BF3
MRKRITSLSLFAFLGLGTVVFAQVTGVVNDANNFPEADVEVSIKGTSNVVYTDAEGKFDIDAKIGDILVVNGKDFKVTSSNLGVIKYTVESKELDEVVVVAFGKQRKEAIVGSVSVIDEKVLEKQVATNPLSALQGSASGVSIVNNGGQPGAAPSIRIRGIGSINASAEPLIVVDGVPFNGNISMISQDMIKSITVLKDAGSTALYGARASNGVILIETKGGKMNMAPQVSFSSQFGVADQSVKLHKRVSSDDFMKYTWEAIKNTNGAESATSGLIARLGYNPYGPNFPNPIDVNGNLLPGAQLLWDTDWENLLINNAATRREYSLSVDGGSEKTTYSFGGGYLNQEGSVRTSRFERTTLRANIVSKATDWLELGFNSLISFNHEVGPTQSGNTFQSPIQWINNMSSIYPLHRRNPNGELIRDIKGNLIYDYGNNGRGVNERRPILSIENAVGALENYRITNKVTNVSVSGFAKINFTDFLSLKTHISYQSYLLDNSNWSSNLYGNAASVNGRVTKNRDTQATKNIINSLNFDKSFGDHNLKIDAIMELYDYNYETMRAQGTGFVSGIDVLSGTTKPETVSGRVSRERNLSYMSRVSYEYSKKYFLEGLYKKEASSRFGPDHRWGDFYAAGAGWIISRENFLKGSKIVSNLKLRGAYGETGNNRILEQNNGGNIDNPTAQNFFPYSQNYEAGWSNLDAIGLNISPITDPNLTWEKQVTTNIGLDFGFFNDRISGSIEYYNKVSKDLIMDLAISPSGSVGYLGYTTNIGVVRNYGFDFNLRTANIRKKDFEWTTSINVGTYRNKLTKLNGAQSIIKEMRLLEVGASIYDFYLWEWAGVDPTDGRAMWYTDDEDGNKVTTKNYASAKRYKQNKSSLPDFEGGFTNYFRYKNFDLNILFNFSVGSYIYDSTYANLMSSGNRAGNQWSENIGNRWQNPGDITNVPVLTISNNDDISRSTRFLFKNDYLRLKALNVGYNFSDKNVRQMGIKGLRIYFQGDNLLTFQSHKGIDPEQNIVGITNNRSYQQRVYTLGFNVKL